MRAVVDVNVLISAVLSASGSPAAVLRAGREGRFDIILSRLLLQELTRALAYPKLRQRISPNQATSLVNWLTNHGTLVEDPDRPAPVGSRDPGDNYLLAVAAEGRAYLVTGDQDLLVLGDDLPVLTPAQFLAQLDAAE